MLSGKSTTAKTSVSPKAKYNVSNLPPTVPKNCCTACRRLVPPSLVKACNTVPGKRPLHKKLRHINLLVTEPLLILLLSSVEKARVVSLPMCSRSFAQASHSVLTQASRRELGH